MLFTIFKITSHIIMLVLWFEMEMNCYVTASLAGYSVVVEWRQERAVYSETEVGRGHSAARSMSHNLMFGTALIFANFKNKSIYKSQCVSSCTSVHSMQWSTESSQRMITKPATIRDMHTSSWQKHQEFTTIGGRASDSRLRESGFESWLRC